MTDPSLNIAPDVQLTGYSAASSGFKNSLSRLRTFQLAIGGRDGVIIADELGQAR